MPSLGSAVAEGRRVRVWLCVRRGNKAREDGNRERGWDSGEQSASIMRVLLMAYVSLEATGVMMWIRGASWKMGYLCPRVALQRNKTGALCWVLSSSDLDSGGDGSYLSGTRDCERIVLEGGTGHGRRCVTSPHTCRAQWGHRRETGVVPEELLDTRRSAKGILPSGLQFLVEFVCLLQLNGDCFPNPWEILDLKNILVPN